MARGMSIDKQIEEALTVTIPRLRREKAELIEVLGELLAEFRGYDFSEDAPASAVSRMAKARTLVEKYSKKKG